MGDGTSLGRSIKFATTLYALVSNQAYRDKHYKHKTAHLCTVDPVPLLALFELHRRSNDEMQPVSNRILLFD